MHNTSANNKRIAKNTFILYVRMLFLMSVNLYASRVLLSTLGVEDYGIYSAVGGFVAMFHVFNGAMATATQRFLSFEIGRGDNDRITQIFSTSMVIHVFLAFLIFIIAETIGLWFLNVKMVFPEGRYAAANWVFQFSILTFIINVISVPYNAALIAYEKMSAFAYVSILDGVLKLLIIYLIIISNVDKLVLYSFLISLVAISIRIIYGFYVKRNLSLCRNNWMMDRSVRGKMLSFVSWNLIGSTAGIAQEQGISVLLNVFFGAAVNAARGISMQVLHAVSGFVSNFNLAMNPLIIKTYASGDRNESFRIAMRGSKFSFMLMLILSTPIFVEAPYILNLWLVKVPEHTVVFLRIVLLITLVHSLKHTLIATIHASGIVKLYQLTNGIFSMMTIPIAYVVLRLGFPPLSALLVSLVITIASHFLRLEVMRRTISFPVALFLKEVTFRMGLVWIVALSLPLSLSLYLEENIYNFIILSTLAVLYTAMVCFFVGLSFHERIIVMKKIELICKSVRR